MSVAGAPGEVQGFMLSSPEVVRSLLEVATVPASLRRPWVILDMDLAGQVGVLVFPKSRRPPRGFGAKARRGLLVGERCIINGQSWTVEGSQEVAHLAEAVPLAEVREREVGEIIAIFHDRGALSRAIRGVFQLGGELKGVAQGSGSILKAESLSLFLVEEWLSWGAQVYKSQGAGWWAPWGKRHPWAGRLGEAGAEILLGSRSWRALRVDWTNPDKALVFKGLPEREPLSFSAPQEIELELHLVEGGRGLARAWLFNASELAQMEDALRQLSYSDLAGLRLAVLEAAGESFFMLRSLTTGVVLEAPVALSEHPDLVGLYLPVGWRIEPQLPVQVLARAIALDSDELAVFLASPRLRLLRLLEGAFGELGRLVDFVLAQHEEALRAWLGESSLNFDGFLTLPRRPANYAPSWGSERSAKGAHAGFAVRPNAAVQSQPDLAAQGPVVPQPAAPSEPASAQSALPSNGEDAPDTVQQEPAVLAFVEGQEPLVKHAARSQSSGCEAMEVAALDALGDPRKWQALARCYLTQERLEAAAAAYEHALWVAHESERAALQESYRALLLDVADDGPRWRLKRELWGGVVKETAAYQSLVERLRAQESKLSVKAAVLAWRELLRERPDPVQMLRVAESSLARLALRGVREVDSFDFVRRVIRQRTQSQGRIAPRLLGILQQEKGLLADARVSRELDALLALAAGELGELDLNAGFAEVVKDRAEVSYQVLSAWGVLLGRQGDARAERLFDEAWTRLESVESGWARDRGLGLVLGDLESAALFGGEGSLVERAFELISRSSPERQCMQLYERVEVLKRLGGRARALELAVELVQALYEKRDIETAYFGVEVIVKLGAMAEVPMEVRRGWMDTLLMHSGLGRVGSRALRLIAIEGGLAPERLLELSKRAGPLGRAVLLATAATLYGAEGLGTRAQAIFEKGMAVLVELESSASLVQALRELSRALLEMGHGEWLRAQLDQLVNALAHGRWGLDRVARAEVLADLVHYGLSNRALSLIKIAEIFAEFLSQENLEGRLFRALGAVIEGLAEQELTAPLERLFGEIGDALASRKGAEYPYYAHLAQVKSALALVSIASPAGGERVGEAAQALLVARRLSPRERADLVLEALASFSSVEWNDEWSAAVAALLPVVLEHGVLSDHLRRDFFRGLIREAVLQQGVFRRALALKRVEEEAILREGLLELLREQAG